MQKNISTLFELSFCTLCYLSVANDKALAQIAIDGTTSTTINAEGDNFQIENGDRAGTNLFHSFDRFSIPDGGSAIFNHGTDISNIFSRVTGGNISNINGLIQSNGDANLFLINPAGIIFGENARLDIGGSFYGSSATSILFEDGEFSAADLASPPLLTVNAPIGLGFRDNPGDIINRSIVENSNEDIVGLEVLSGNRLTFVGGNINFEGGNATARGGDIELGGISQAGTVSINEDGSLAFAEDIIKAELNFVGIANLDVTGTGGGNITLNAQNLNAEAEGNGNNFITAGIADNSTVAGTQAGNVLVNVTEDITLNNSRIANEVISGGAGNSGNITIATGNLTLTNGSSLFANTAGIGNAGLIDLTATDTISVDGESSVGNISSIISGVSAGAEGNAGSINIATGNLIFTNGGSIFANTEGIGNAGSVNITASDTVTFDGANSEGFIPGGIVSVVLAGAEGNAGDLNIITSSLNFTNGARIDASTEGMGNAGLINITASDTVTFDGETSQGFFSSAISSVRGGAVGNAGDITITTGNLNFTNGGAILADTQGQGNAASVNITASDTIAFDGNSTEFTFASGIVSEVDDDALGDAGNINLAANNINFTNGGRVDASTEGIGNAGSVNLTAIDTITFGGQSSGSVPSGIVSVVDPEAEGDAGNINLAANNINFTNGGSVNASTEGLGNAGLINLNATNSITFDGETSAGSISSAISEVGTDAEGNAGGVSITAPRIIFTNGGSVFANARGRGNAGNIDVVASDTVTFDGESLFGIPTGLVSVVLPEAEGDSGNINITTGNLNFTNGGRIDASTEGIGNAGSIEIIATDTITFDGENSQGVVSSAISSVRDDAEGNAGDITISTGDLNFINGGSVFTSTRGRGNAASVNITARDTITFDGESLESVGGFAIPSGIASTVDEGAQGNAGDINLTANNLNFTNGGRVDASTEGIGNAGSIDIVASDTVTFDGESPEGVASGAISSVRDDAEGNAGGVNINGDRIIFANGGNVIASAEGQGNAGNINITTNSLFLDRGEITAETNFETGGEITLNVEDNLILRNNSTITAQAFEDADGGNININGNFIIAFPNQLSGVGSDIVANAERGNGGNINILAESLFGIDERPLSGETNDINASSQVDGLDGTVSINTPDLNRVQTDTDLPESLIKNQQTQAQSCQSDRSVAAQSSFAIKGKGGIPVEPGHPLNSLNVVIDGKTNSTSSIPQPIATSQGNIQPARGIKITETGEIILTVYRTSNSGERLPEVKRNCSRV